MNIVTVAIEGGHRVSSEEPRIVVEAATLRAAMTAHAAAWEQLQTRPARLRRATETQAGAPTGYPAAAIGSGSGPVDHSGGGRFG